MHTQSTTIPRRLASSFRSASHTVLVATRTGTASAKIDEWIDLKRYLLNGQEYLELVDAVKFALNNLERVYPGYAGQKAVLAGLVWFEGIKDAHSDSMAEDYRKHLPNLIRDLRKDLKAPTLPVGVAAIGFGGENMNADTLKVFEAQMAVGNPNKHPEFAGNVKSVDTRGFYRPAERSPGGQAWCYNNNAETFLLIGEAQARAMMQLTDGDESTKTTK